jgi:hypothetical protein
VHMVGTSSVSYVKGAFRHLVELNKKNKRNVPVAVFIV